MNNESLDKRIESLQERMQKYANESDQLNLMIRQMIDKMDETCKKISAKSKDIEPLPKTKKTAVPLEVIAVYPVIDNIDTSDIPENMKQNRPVLFFLEDYSENKDIYNNLLKSVKPVPPQNLMNEVTSVYKLYKFLHMVCKINFTNLLKARKPVDWEPKMQL